MEIIVRLCSVGLIHGDFNEFNIMIKEEEQGEDVQLVPVLIDFPQMVSVDHPNAEFYFERDVECVKRFFERRFGFTSTDKGPLFEKTKLLVGKDASRRLDIEVEASGFSKKMAKELEGYMKEHGVDGDAKDDETNEDAASGSEVEEEGEGEDDQDEEPQNPAKADNALSNG